MTSVCTIYLCSTSTAIIKPLAQWLEAGNSKIRYQQYAQHSSTRTNQLHVYTEGEPPPDMHPVTYLLITTAAAKRICLLPRHNVQFHKVRATCELFTTILVQLDTHCIGDMNEIRRLITLVITRLMNHQAIGFRNATPSIPLSRQMRTIQSYITRLYSAKLHVQRQRADLLGTTISPTSQ